MDAKTRGTVLALCGVALLVVTLSVGAATAPDRTIGDGQFETPASSGTDGSSGTGTGGTGGSDGSSGGSSDGASNVRRTLVGMQGGGDLWHHQGSVFMLHGVEKVWEEGSADSYFDVTQLENGSVVAGFIHSGYEDCGQYSSPCARTGFRVIDPDPEPTVTGEYSFPVRTITNSEVHDVEVLDDGRFLMTDMDAERIFIVEDGEEVWSWNASTIYDAPRDPTRTDWLHINDVDVIGEDRYLVSVRNANQLVVVEKGTGVVEIINEDDGPDDGRRQGDPDVINHQHNPQWLGDGKVLVADSDNHRVVELHRTDNGTWRPAWILNHAGGKDLFWPRDADRLPNGNTLVTDTLNKRIFEVTPQGEVVWGVGTNRIPYEADRLPVGEEAGIEAEQTNPSSDGGSDGTTEEGETTTDGGSDGTNETSDTVDDGGASDGGDDGPTDVKVIGSANEEVPGLSPLLVGMRAIYPETPFWFAESHLAASLCSLLLIVGGLVYRFRAD